MLTQLTDSSKHNNKKVVNTKRVDKNENLTLSLSESHINLRKINQNRLLFCFAFCSLSA